LGLQNVNLQSDLHLPSMHRLSGSCMKHAAAAKTRADRKTKSKDMDGAIS
jgi:hypothetical protein